MASQHGQQAIQVTDAHTFTEDQVIKLIRDHLPGNCGVLLDVQQPLADTSKLLRLSKLKSTTEVDVREVYDTGLTCAYIYNNRWTIKGIYQAFKQVYAAASTPDEVQDEVRRAAFKPLRADHIFFSELKGMGGDLLPSGPKKEVRQLGFGESFLYSLLCVWEQLLMQRSLCRETPQPSTRSALPLQQPEPWGWGTLRSLQRATWFWRASSPRVVLDARTPTWGSWSSAMRGVQRWVQLHACCYSIACSFSSTMGAAGLLSHLHSAADMVGLL